MRLEERREDWQGMRERITRYTWDYDNALHYQPHGQHDTIITNATHFFIHETMTTYERRTRQGTAYVLLLECGDGVERTQHYIYCECLDFYVHFLRMYGNVTHVFDHIVHTMLDTATQRNTLPL